MKACPVCNVQNGDNLKTCFLCGADLSGGKQQGSVYQQDNRYQGQEFVNSKYNKGKKIYRTSIAICALIGGIALIVFFVVFFGTMSNKKATSADWKQMNDIMDICTRIWLIIGLGTLIPAIIGKRMMAASQFEHMSTDFHMIDPPSAYNPPFVPPAPTYQSTGADPLKQIEKLSELRDKGALTQEEFDQKKTELLKRI